MFLLYIYEGEKSVRKKRNHSAREQNVFNVEGELILMSQKNKTYIHKTQAVAKYRAV